ncbi:YciI family protein [Aliikangiella coralliicola]|uniref:YCII-related domain-containing protein n=1 Tax=Aliikangiella coralliicola TaxID=2592383 RepID=A0A545UAR6_9GAMM|nr:hypothetical protein [Aliikangiella coralliicola]TQV86547.1 hypothetical protein FLL46_16715 [Aliikangiella coralliicola]
MFIVFLRFSANKAKAPDFIQGHKAWIQQGIKEGLFLIVGSLQPDQGGCIIANNIEKEALESRISEDPFVTENIVKAEVFEVTPSMTIENLQFLMAA